MIIECPKCHAFLSIDYARCPNCHRQLTAPASKRKRAVARIATSCQFLLIAALLLVSAAVLIGLALLLVGMWRSQEIMVTLFLLVLTVLSLFTDQRTFSERLRHATAEDDLLKKEEANACDLASAPENE